MHKERDTTDKEKFYLKLFSIAHADKWKTAKAKKNDEEFYYSDIDGTRTQFSQKVKNEIVAKYDIDISTKISFAILEQFIAFLAGTKPTTRLIANTEQQKAWTYLYEPLFSNVWTESDTDSELNQAIRDFAVVGEGYLYVKPNDFFQESTFNVQHCYVPWTDVFIDPASRKIDRSDAEYIIIAKPSPVWKVEAEFGVSVRGNDHNSLFGSSEPATPIDDIPDTYPEFITATDEEDIKRKRKWVWVKNIFHAKETLLFISVEGHTSHKRPTPVTIPNPQKAELSMQIQAMSEQLQIAEEQVGQQQAGAEALMSKEEQGGGNQEILGAAAQGRVEAEQGQGEIQEARLQLQQMMMQLQGMPDELHIYQMETETKNTVYVEKFEKIKKKRIKRLLQVDRYIVEEEWIPSDKFPISSFVYSQNRAPHKSYGLIHYIKDLVKAMNKFWALMIHDLQIAGHGKWIAAKGTIQNPRKWESMASVPGALLEYESDMNLPDGGRPTYQAGTPPDRSMAEFITMLTQLCEYVSGIFGVMQGNAETAPSTLGATQSLQSFGTQRIKGGARSIEKGLSMLTYCTVQYLQRYCPDEAVKLLDDNGDGQELLLLRDTVDTKFKCRTQMTNSLPTVRQMAMQMLATIAGQSGNPIVQDLLVEYTLRLSDVPEMDEMAEKLDVIKGLQQQVQEQQQQLQEQDNQLKAAENNLAQKDIAMSAEKAKGDIAASAEIEKVKQQAKIQQQGQAPQEQATLF